MNKEEKQKAALALKTAKGRAQFMLDSANTKLNECIGMKMVLEEKVRAVEGLICVWEEQVAQSEEALKKYSQI